MDTHFDENKLVNHKLFKDLKCCLKDNSNDTLCNLLELIDDVLFVWNPVENCLHSINLKHLDEHEEETPYQTLQPVSPPPFSVQRLTSSSCGSRICAWGNRGALVVELPLRWGRGTLFDSGASTVLCKSQCVDERLLFSLGEVRRVLWHPHSSSHILVLLSDNTIRLYSVGPKSGASLERIYTVGPKPSGALAGRALLDTLGDTAVDIAPTPDSRHLLILRGDGDIYMMAASMDIKMPKVSGPLAMYPPADDNYGTESCALCVVGAADGASLVVVATCAATLYHCLLLPDAEDADGHSLYAVEAVELDVGLDPGLNGDTSYPVQLYPCTYNSYLCMHAGGVHTVSLPILDHLKDYALAEDGEAALGAVCSRPSVARHLVCTRSAATPRPPLGLAATPPPLPAVLTLCPPAELIVRTLEPYFLEEQLFNEMQLKNPSLESDDINQLLKERQKVSFTAIMREVLAKAASQPLLSLDKTEERTPQEMLELLTQCTARLRAEYVARGCRARDALATKCRALASCTRHRSTCQRALLEEIEKVEGQALVLREKCSLAEKRQEDIKHRCGVVVRALRAGSAPAAAERELFEALKTQRALYARYAERVAVLKKHAAGKAAELRKWRTEYKRKDTALGHSHSDTISSVLQQQTSLISSLIEETKALKEELNVV